MRILKLLLIVTNLLMMASLSSSARKLSATVDDRRREWPMKPALSQGELVAFRPCSCAPKFGTAQ